jgi:hypothetical protein
MILVTSDASWGDAVQGRGLALEALISIEAYSAALRTAHAEW